MKFHTGRIPRLIANLSIGLLLTVSATAEPLWSQGSQSIATIDEFPLNVTAINVGTQSGPTLMPGLGVNANGSVNLNQLGTLALSGSAWLTNPNLTSSQNSILLLSSGQLSDSSWDLSRPLGFPAFDQVMPPAPTSTIPSSVANLSSQSSFAQLAQQAARPSIAVARPDFSYVAAKREFEKVSNSSTTGQKDLSVGSGIPAGHRKFIPVGEF